MKGLALLLAFAIASVSGCSTEEASQAPETDMVFHWKFDDAIRFVDEAEGADGKARLEAQWVLARSRPSAEFAADPNSLRILVLLAAKLHLLAPERRPELMRFFGNLARSPDPSDRGLAARTMALISDENVGAILFDLLDDSSEMVTRSAIISTNVQLSSNGIPLEERKGLDLRMKEACRRLGAAGGTRHCLQPRRSQ